MHVHVEKGDSEAKFHIAPLELIENHGFKNNEIRMIEAIIEENLDIIRNRWMEYFKTNNNHE